MKWTMLVVGCASLALSASSAQARECDWSGRGGPRSMHFDPAAVITVSGEVLSVQVVDGRRRSGVHLELKSGADVLDVHLGPSWYLDQQKTKIAKGDRIEVTGAKATFTGKPALVATQVKKANDVLLLRDGDGCPVWAPRSHGQSGSGPGRRPQGT